MIKRPAKKRAGARAPRSSGRQQAPRLGDRLAKTQIALRSKIDRGTLARYLAMQGAPRPDAGGRYSYRDVMAWVEKQAPRAGARVDSEASKLRERLLRAQVEQQEHDLAVKRRRYVDKAEIGPAFAAFCTQLTEDMRNKFEAELPPKYEGKSTVERTQLNAAAVDWVLERLKNGGANVAT